MKELDREYVGWTQEVIYEWEDSMFYLPMWHQSMWMPSQLWEFYKELNEIDPNYVKFLITQTENSLKN